MDFLTFNFFVGLHREEIVGVIIERASEELGQSVHKWPVVRIRNKKSQTAFSDV